MKLTDESGSICVDVTIPGPIGRAKGLIGTQDPPAPGHGILLKGGQIHTFGMRYPIDVVHLDGVGRVIRIRTMQPNRLGRREKRARQVLELAVGEAARMRLHEGLLLILQNGACR